MSATGDPRDVEYRLDAEHIRGVCQAWRPESTVNVTHVDYPSHVYVDVKHRHLVAEVLRQVGYLAEVPAEADQLAVTGWSTARLAAREAALAGILDRWHGTLADTAARAVDLHALDGYDWSANIAVDRATRRAVDLLRYETELITGPHVTHDPHIRPHDNDQARLIAGNQHLEQAIADHLGHAERVAGYAVQAYIDDPHAQTEPYNARARAITGAMGRYSADIRREYAERRPASQAPSGPPSRDHPAAVAANDQPTGQPADAIPPARTSSPSTPGDTAGMAPPPPRGRTP